MRGLVKRPLTSRLTGRIRLAMPLNETPRKSQIVATKVEPKKARLFLEEAAKEGGASAVLRKFIDRYLRRRGLAA